MATSLPKDRQSTELQSLELRMAKASIGLHRVDGVDDGAIAIVVASLNAIGMSDKEACLEMGFDASQFSKVKQGRARLPIEALWRLPDRFWIEFRRRIDTEKGLTPESIDDIEMAWMTELFGLLLRRAFRARSKAVSA